MISLSQMKSADVRQAADFPMPPDSGIRIVLIDDNELRRAGLKSLISTTEDFTVVGEAKDKTQAIGLIRREQPHIILLNIELRCGGGLEMIPNLLTACRTSRLVVLTDSSNPEVHRKAMLYGAAGIISKEDPFDLLINAIERVHSGGVWFYRFVGRQYSSSNGEKIATLTNSEREIIKLIGEGLKIRDIAERLFISKATTYRQLTSIYSKLEVKSKLELIIYAYRNRLANLPGKENRPYPFHQRKGRKNGQ